MATFTYLGQGYSGPGYGLASIATSPNLITVNFTSGVTDNYFGSFAFNETEVTTGVVTGLSESYFGQVIFTGAGMNVSAPALATAVQTVNLAAMAELIFAGSDSILGSNFGEVIYGGSGDDVVIALSGNDSVVGGIGNDDINGNQGEDVVVGGAGVDIVRGGQGADTITGDDGDDPHVNGNLGNDAVSGGNGNDTVYGGQGSDTVLGDAGNDVISGDLGDDILSGGSGADRFMFRTGGGIDIVADFNAAEGDRIVMPMGTTYVLTQASGSVVIALTTSDAIGLAGVAPSAFSTSWIVFE